jgi:hypothetical protein
MASRNSTKLLLSKSKSKLCYDWLSVDQSAWCQAPIWVLRPDLYYCQTVTSLLMWGALSDERMGLPFTIAAGPRQRSHFWVRVSRDSWPYFTVSDSRLPQPGGPGPRTYNHQEQGGPVIPAGTGFPFKSKSHCDWRSVSQSVLVSNPIWGSWRVIFSLSTAVSFGTLPYKHFTWATQKTQALYC